MRKIYSLVLMAAALLVGTNAWADNVLVATGVVDEVTTLYYQNATADVENHIYATDFDALKAAVQAGGAVTLEKDVNYGNISSTSARINIASSVTCELDLNNKTLSGSISATKQGATDSKCVFYNEGNLTIANGTITSTNTGNHYSKVVDNRNTLSMTNVNITVDKGHCVRSFVGDVTLTNCNFLSNCFNSAGNSNDDAAIQMASTGNLTINGGTYKGGFGGALYANNIGRVTINGGTFNTGYVGGVASDLMIFNAEVIVDIVSANLQMMPSLDWLNVNSGYTYSNNRYIVAPIAARLTPVSVSNLSDLETAVNSATLTQPIDITLSGNVTINKVVTLPHGSTLTIPAATTLTLAEGGALINEGVVTNNGTISYQGNGYLMNPEAVEGTVSQSTFIVNSSDHTITGTISTAMDLQWMSYISGTTENIEDYTWIVSMSQDITLPNVPFKAIPFFKGTFDGQNHKIHNLQIKTSTVATAMIVWFKEGEFKNVTIDAEVVSERATVAVIAYGLDNAEEESVVTVKFENVTVNGSVSIDMKSYGCSAFVCYPSIKNLSNVWFVNCINNANVVGGPECNNFGGFVGSLTGTKINLGFYNCINNGNILSADAPAKRQFGAFVGYLSQQGGYMDFISCANNGTVTGSSATDNQVLCGQNLQTKYRDITYIDPTTWVAYWNSEDKRYRAKHRETVNPSDDNTYTAWGTNETWNEEGTPTVPTAEDNVTIAEKNIVIGGTGEENYNAEANQITITNADLTVSEGSTLTIGVGGLEMSGTGKLIVEAGADVRVAGEVTNATADNIVIESDASGTAVFMVDPNYDMEEVKATVSLHTYAHKNGDTYYYNYIGIPTTTAITSATLSRTPSDATIYPSGWDVVNGWQSGGWELFAQPFKGIALTSDAPTDLTLTFTGTLVGNGDGTMNFNHKGFHFFANSYTAPINIRTLIYSFDEDVQATVYMYSQTSNQIIQISKSNYEGFFSDPIAEVIPSMQGFFIYTDEHGAVTESIDYREMIWNNTANNTALHTPARQNSNFDRIRLMVSAQDGSYDNINIIGADRFSSEYENGYDVVKFVNEGMSLFVNTSEHALQDLFTDNIEGSFIGFTANATDNSYTLTFSELKGEQLSIKDLMTGAVTLMTEGNSYTFFQPAGTTIDNRFQIVGRNEMPTSIENMEKEMVVAEGIYNIAGQFMGTVDKWNDMPKGVYIVNGVKVVK